MAKRREYSPEFNREAVQMADAPATTLRQVARDLGIAENLIGHWRRELHDQGISAFGGKGQARDEEMMQLKRDLAKVKKEPDFLAEAS